MTVVFICYIFGKQNILFFCPFSCVSAGRHVISLELPHTSVTHSSLTGYLKTFTANGGYLEILWTDN